MSYPASSLSGMTSAHEVVAAYWAAAEARDWDAFGALLADDVIYRGPQAREQVGGRDAYLRFNAKGFPYEWHITVRRIVGEGQHAASWVEIAVPEGTDTGLCFFDLADDGTITQLTTDHRRTRQTITHRLRPPTSTELPVNDLEGPA
jgi:hypothetical protein